MNEMVHRLRYLVNSCVSFSNQTLRANNQFCIINFQLQKKYWKSGIVKNLIFLSILDNSPSFIMQETKGWGGIWMMYLWTCVTCRLLIVLDKNHLFLFFNNCSNIEKQMGEL